MNGLDCGHQTRLSSAEWARFWAKMNRAQRQEANRARSIVPPERKQITKFSALNARTKRSFGVRVFAPPVHRDIPDNIFAGLVMDVDLACSAAEAGFGILWRACLILEGWLDAWLFERHPRAFEFLRRPDFDDSQDFFVT